VVAAAGGVAVVTEFLVAISRLMVPTRRNLSTTKEAGFNSLFGEDR
jgi:hypothetical protein